VANLQEMLESTPKKKFPEWQAHKLVVKYISAKLKKSMLLSKIMTCVLVLGKCLMCFLQIFCTTD